MDVKQARQRIIDDVRNWQLGPVDLSDLPPISAIGPFVYVGTWLWPTDKHTAELLLTHLRRERENRPGEVKGDGRRWLSAKGRAYFFDGENVAEMTIQKGLATFDLAPFSFIHWPATEMGGEIFVGEPPYQVRWPKDGDKQAIEHFLKQVCIAESFREKAAALAVEDRPTTSAADGAKCESSLETQQWFENLSHATAFSQAPKDTRRSHSETSTSTADDSATLPNSSAPAKS
jgi:hypothetical protein